MSRLPLRESDWLVSADPRAMLECLFEPRSEGSSPDLPRKLRLYLTAIGRKQWKRMPWAARTTLAIAERMADGMPLDQSRYTELYGVAEQLTTCGGNPDAVAACDARLRDLGFGNLVPTDPPPRPLSAADWTAVTRLAFVPLWRRGPFDNWIAPHLHDADLVRDIFRHPDLPYRFPARWRTTDVVGLAAGMYENRDFAGMPVLADALEEAGCDDRALLDHSRAKEPHVRGCWVVDLILDQPTGRDKGWSGS